MLRHFERCPRLRHLREAEYKQMELWVSVQELIEELKKMPQLQPVRLLIRAGYEDYQACGDLSDVRFEGNHISLEANDV